MVTIYQYSAAAQVFVSIYSKHTWNIKTQINDSENEVMDLYQLEDSRLEERGTLSGFPRERTHPIQVFINGCCRMGELSFV